MGRLLGQLCTVEKWAENLEEVTLSRWLIAEGQAVARGDPLCEIITDKVTFEYESESPGVLRRQYCRENSVLPVGYTFAFVGEADEALPEGVEAQNQDLLAQHRARAELDLELDLFARSDAAAAPRSPTATRTRATPAARRVAREQGVTVEEVARELDVAGVVTEADVLRYVARGVP